MSVSGGDSIESGRGLKQLLDAHLGTDGVDLLDVSPAARRLAQSLGDQELARTLVHTSFWFLLAPPPSRYIANVPLGPPIRSLLEDIFPRFDPENVRTVVVAHGQPLRYDLLVLDPSYLGPTVGESIDISSELSRQFGPGWPDVQTRRLDTTRYLLENTLRRADYGVDVDMRDLWDAVREATERVPSGLVVAREPPLVPTNCLSPAMPLGRDGTSVGTIGAMIGGGGEADTFAITAYHPIAGAVAGTVTVAGLPADIANADVITDSCILRVTSRSPGSSKVSPRHWHRPLRRPPRYPDPAHFDGITSGPTTTMVRGVDQSILLGLPDFASLVYTDNNTVEGDSGAALLDQDGFSIGYAVRRTAFGSDPSYSLWVWAAQVVDAHSRWLADKVSY